MSRVFIGFGGNVGDVEENLRFALAAVAGLSGTRIRRVSSLYRSAPVGVSSQPWFVNGVAEIETSLGPSELLAELLTIEQGLGRTREVKWGPRTVDLDIVLWNQEVWRTESLEIPHPRMHERGFVLVPLAEVAPTAKHPVLGKTVRELLVDLGPTEDVEWLGRPRWADALQEDPA